MRVRVLPILATMVLGVVLVSGVVLAKNKLCHSNCKGTNGNDYLVGDGSSNHISGLAGDDYVGGRESADTLLGGSDNDKVQGGSGKDNLKGGLGVDKVLGKRGYDHLLDQPERGSFAQLSSQHGAYQVQAAGRPDRLLGGRGNDTIRARDGKRDIVRGGPGYDKAYVDPVDDVKGVEVERCSGGGCTKPPGNKPPVAKKDSYSVYNDTHLKVTDSAKGVLSNDSDADNPNNTNAGLTVKDADSNTQGIQPETGPTEGDLTLNADGTFDYEHTGGCSPQPACIPPPDSFTYKATDGAADSKVATVKITVCDYNDPNNPPNCPPPPP